jgi:hypothetical protein
MSICNIVNLTVALLLVTASGCEVAIPRFEQSNQVFVEQTIANIKIADALKPSIPTGSKVAIVSMEDAYTRDVPIVAMIEDNLIQGLYNSGIQVMERDRDLIRWMVRERFKETFSVVEGDLINSKDSVSRPYSMNILKTQLTSVDYIVAYRVLECGLIYTNRDAKQGMTTREGLVRLHVRVLSARTGQILFAKQLDGLYKDAIANELVSALKEFHYSFYSYQYPAYKGE